MLTRSSVSEKQKKNLNILLHISQWYKIYGNVLWKCGEAMPGIYFLKLLPLYKSGGRDVKTKPWDEWRYIIEYVDTEKPDVEGFANW